MTNPNSPLTSAIYPAANEETVIANLEKQGFTILLVESLK